MGISEEIQKVIETYAQNPQDQQRILEEAIWGKKPEFNPPP